jgi:hypothetical protein
MHLKITPNKQVGELVEEFQQFFPYLKLSFYSSKDGVNGHGKGKPVNAQTTLKEISRNIADGVVDVSGGVSVRQLEKTFNDSFFLNVQVQRRSGNIWLETTITDNWTLEHQNDHGRDITANMEL